MILPFLLLAASVVQAAVPVPSPGPAFKPVLEFLGRLPVQSGGRVKPLDTMARDAVLSLSERRSLRGELSSDEPLVAALKWLAHGEKYSKQPLIYVSRADVKKRIGLDESRSVFSPVELANAPRLQDEMTAISRKQEQSIKLNNTEQALARVVNKLELYQSLATGTGWALVPAAPAWISVADERAAASGIPQLLSRLLGELFDSGKPEAERVEAAQSYANEIASRQAVEVLRLGKDPAAAEPELAVGLSLDKLAASMNREVGFNRLRPFQKSWMLYLTSFLLFALALGAQAFKSAPFLRIGAWAALLAAFALHSYGFVVRSLITGRPPVTNMYESTIWVPWGVVLFALIISLFNRKSRFVHIVPAAAAAVTALSLVLSDNVPAVLDPTIKPLEPVLRSNYWLTIHVLTITLSYGAFALALGLGNVAMAYYAFKPRAQETIAQYAQFMYRAVQFGVVLLAAGTILGGVWADYSWGRFWGWDPKETWALIALLLYIVILHGKWAGWLRQFGLVIGTVLCFNGVLMAWYGVNFVLGVGLHSYGFSNGGLEYIAVFVALQLAFTAFVAAVHMKRQALQSP